MVIKGKVKSDSVAERQLLLLTDIKFKLAESRYNLDNESHQRIRLENMQKIQLAIKRERTVERHVGSSKWLVHIVLLICDIIVNGTTPSAVADNIQTISDTMNGRKVNEFPSNKFVRQCRVVVQNLNSTLAEMRLGDAYECHKLFTDGTLRRQIAFQNLVIAVMVD